MADNCLGGTIVHRGRNYAVLPKEMSREQLSTAFLEFIGKEFGRLRSQYHAYCKVEHIIFDADVLSDTIVRCAEKIIKDGITAKTEYDFECYFFRSFSKNIRREREYARNSRRSDVFEGDIDKPYQRWYDENNVSHMSKVEKDLFEDFSVLYLLSRASDALPSVDVHLFKLKTFCPDKYHERQREMKDAAKRVRKVRQWLRENVTKEEVDNAFKCEYGDILAD